MPDTRKKIGVVCAYFHQFHYLQAYLMELNQDYRFFYIPSEHAARAIIFDVVIEYAKESWNERTLRTSAYLQGKGSVFHWRTISLEHESQDLAIRIIKAASSK